MKIFISSNINILKFHLHRQSSTNYKIQKVIYIYLKNNQNDNKSIIFTMQIFFHNLLQFRLPIDSNRNLNWNRILYLVNIQLDYL